MPTINGLKQATKRFMNLHWHADSGPEPDWSDGFPINGTSGLVTNGNMSGCYAIVKEDELLYVGVGRSMSKGIYKDNALDTRIRRHVYRVHRASNTYMALPKWKDAGATHVVTIGFPTEVFYLASALEEFLIYALTPPHNTVGLRRGV